MGKTAKPAKAAEDAAAPSAAATFENAPDTGGTAERVLNGLGEFSTVLALASFIKLAGGSGQTATDGSGDSRRCKGTSDFPVIT